MVTHEKKKPRFLTRLFRYQNTSKTEKTSPQDPAITWAEIRFAFYGGGGLVGKSLLDWEVRKRERVRLSRLIGGWDVIRSYALHECRDSACWRPCGGRLRGSFSFYRLISDICAAPLRMTRGVFVAWAVQYDSVKVTLQRIGYISQNIIPTVSF